MKLSELKIKKPKILIYGSAGTGKTAFSLTGGQGTTVLDMDNGLRTGLSLHDEFFDQRNAVDVFQALEDDPLKAVAFKRARPFIMNFKPQDDTEIFVLDSLTALAEAAMRENLSNASRLNKQAQIQDWGNAFREIKLCLLKIRSLSCSAVVIAHEQIRTIDEQDTIQLAVSGKNLPTEIMAMFDEIWHATVKPAGQNKYSFKLQTRPTASILARSRCNIDTVDQSLGLRRVLSLLEGKGDSTDG